jgi:hypothetical protein
MARRLFRLCAILAIASLAAGCVTREPRDGATVYRRPLWPGLVALAFAGLVLGTTIRERAPGKQIFGVASGVVLAIAVGGSFLTERAVVRGDGFEIWRGIWPFHERVAVRFDALRELRYRQDTGGRRKNDPRLEWFTSAGDMASIVTHGVSREACAELKQRATAAGVRVENFPP